MENKTPLPECLQRFDHLSDKLDGLIKRADRINGRYEKHMDDSVLYRRLVDKHDHKIEGIEKSADKALTEKWNTAKASQWRVGIIVGVIMGLVSVLARFWG